MHGVHPTRPKSTLAEGAPLLELEDVRVAYGGIKALKGVSMKVFPGEIVAMIGANGAGKTTTLKSIMGLLPLTSGTIRVGGETISGHADGTSSASPKRGRVLTEDLVAQGISLTPEGR